MVENKSMWFAEKTRMRERWMGGGLNALKEKNEMQRLFFLRVERNRQRMDEQPNPPSTLGISSGFPMENNCPGCHLGQTAEVRYRFLGRGAHCLPLKNNRDFPLDLCQNAHLREHIHKMHEFIKRQPRCAPQAAQLSGLF